MAKGKRCESAKTVVVLQCCCVGASHDFSADHVLHKPLGGIKTKVLKLRLLSPDKNISRVSAARESNTNLSMGPHVLWEQNPALCCGLSLRPVDCQSKSHLDWKLQAAEFKRETLPASSHGNLRQNQNLLVLVASQEQHPASCVGPVWRCESAHSCFSWFSTESTCSVLLRQ